MLFWWASPSEMGLPGHILASKLLVLSKCFCLWLPFTNRKKSLQTNIGTQSDMCYYITPLVHITRGPAQLPEKNRCPWNTRHAHQLQLSLWRQCSQTPAAPHPAPGAPLTLTELSWLEVARMCSLSGCQSRPWILERCAARYSTAVLGFCNRTTNQSRHFTEDSARPPELDTAYPGLLGGDAKILPEELPAGPVARAPSLHGREEGFEPWSGN